MRKVVGIALSIITTITLVYMGWQYMVMGDNEVLDYMEDNPPTTTTIP